MGHKATQQLSLQLLFVSRNFRYIIASLGGEGTIQNYRTRNKYGEDSKSSLLNND